MDFELWILGYGFWVRLALIINANGSDLEDCQKFLNGNNADLNNRWNKILKHYFTGTIPEIYCFLKNNV